MNTQSAINPKLDLRNLTRRGLNARKANCQEALVNYNLKTKSTRAELSSEIEKINYLLKQKDRPTRAKSRATLPDTLPYGQWITFRAFLQIARDIPEESQVICGSSRYINPKVNPQGTVFGIMEDGNKVLRIPSVGLCIHLPVVASHAEDYLPTYMAILAPLPE